MAGEIQTHAFRRKSLPGVLLSRAFAACGSAPHDMVLDEGALFIHRGLVFPKHRGKEVLPQLLARFWQRARAAGLHTALRVVDRASAPAHAAVRRIGVRFRSAPLLKLPGLDAALLGARSVRRSKA